MRSWGMVGLAASLVGLLAGCEVCGGHADGHYYCKGNTRVQCRQGSEIPDRECAPSECREIEGEGPTCILPKTTCPTANLGYQCMGNYRVRCLPDGQVVDIGACPRPLPSGSPRASWQNDCSSDVDERNEECYPPKAPYCVENPGGEALACSWKKEKCDNEGEVRCFEDGSAICSGHVYTAFVSNSAAGQSVCDVTPVKDCWSGKTWCEGDVLKRCDKCLGKNRCAQVTIQAVCDPGACMAYAYPSWLGNAGQSIPRDAMGCAVAAPACDGTKDAVCLGDKPASCVAAGKAVALLTCSEFKTRFGSHSEPSLSYFGPFCVSSASFSAVCAEEPTHLLWSGRVALRSQRPERCAKAGMRWRGVASASILQLAQLESAHHTLRGGDALQLLPVTSV